MKIYKALLLFLVLILVFLGTETNAQHEFDWVRLEEIKSASLSSTRIPGTHLPVDTILLYKTNEGRYGKLLVKAYGYNLTLKWFTFNPNGTLHTKGDNLVIRGTYMCDLDSGKETQTSSDFWWQQVSATERYLTPQNGAIFAPYTNCRVHGIKRIHTSPSKVSFLVQYYIPPTHPKACFICAYIPNRANLSPHFRYNPAGREPIGVPKGQHYFPEGVVFEAEYLGSQPYTTSTIEVVIYEKDRNLCSSIINWGQTWKK